MDSIWTGLVTFRGKMIEWSIVKYRNVNTSVLNTDCWGVLEYLPPFHMNSINKNQWMQMKWAVRIHDTSSATFINHWWHLWNVYKCEFFMASLWSPKLPMATAWLQLRALDRWDILNTFRDFMQSPLQTDNQGRDESFAVYILFQFVCADPNITNNSLGTESE